MFMKCQRWLSSAITSDLILKEITAAVGNIRMPLALVQSGLSDDVQEELGETYGGLLSFARQFKSQFAVAKNTNGLWYIHNLAPQQTLTPIPKPPSTSVPQPQVTHSSRQPQANHVARFRYRGSMRTLPCFAVPLSAISESLGCSESDALDVLHPLIESSSIVVATCGRHTFVAPRDGAGDVTNTSYAEHQTPHYDVCRLARQMSCDHFMSVEELEIKAAATISQPLGQVLMSTPRFECLFSDTNWADALDEEIANAESGKPAAAVHSPKSPLVKKLRQAKFIVPAVIRDKEAALSPLHEEFTYEQLMEQLAELARSSDKGTFKYVKKRRRLLKSMIAKKYPNGNPYLDPDVSAHAIYDGLESCSDYVNSNDLKERYLPDGGKSTCGTSLDFYRSYPNLFNIIEKDGTTILIQRADCGPSITVRPLTEKEIILVMSSNFPTIIDPLKPMSMTLVVSKCTKYCVSEIKRLYTDPEQFFRRFPEVFEVSNPVEHAGQAFILTSQEKVMAWASAAASN